METGFAGTTKRHELRTRTDTKNSILFFTNGALAGFSCYKMPRFDTEGVKKTKNAGVRFQVLGVGESGRATRGFLF
jgi:hypothetical protein